MTNFQVSCFTGQLMCLRTTIKIAFSQVKEIRWINVSPQSWVKELFSAARFARPRRTRADEEIRLLFVRLTLVGQILSRPEGVESALPAKSLVRQHRSRPAFVRSRLWQKKTLPFKSPPISQALRINSRQVRLKALQVFEIGHGRSPSGQFIGSEKGFIEGIFEDTANRQGIWRDTMLQPAFRTE
jgi:hypothetical protein